MLTLSNLTGFGGDGSEAVEVTYIENVESGGDNNSYTFSTVNLGTAFTGRTMVFLVALQSGNPTGVSPSLTFNGNAVDVVYRNYTGNDAFGVFAYPIDTGTTAEIIVSGDGGWDRCNMGVYSLANLQSRVARSGAFDSNYATVSSVTLDAPHKGVIFGVAGSNDSTAPGYIWTELVEDYDTDTERAFSGASKVYTSGAGSKTITTTRDGSDLGYMLAASLR